jgi:AcrR family transcriptional regulator
MIGTRRAHNSTAEVRREAVIDAAIVEFAQKGLHGTATEDIARRAGISQPYIFRLFGTKKDLFIAAAHRMCDRIGDVFAHAAAAEGEGTALDRMGRGFSTLLANRVELLMLLQTFAGTADPDVQVVMKEHMTSLFADVRRLSGEDEAAVRAFMAQGMLLTVLAASDLPQLLGAASWAEYIAMSEHCDAPALPPDPRG